MDAETTLHRRPLPPSSIAFSSEAGRVLFREALESGHLQNFFPLIEQFHTQADPSFCGLGSLVMVLNALGVDPGRVWRGPWRWFSEELLDCCKPLSKVRLAGVTLDEVACLARCNGAEVELASPQTRSLSEFRTQVEQVARSADQMLIAAYLRSALGQTGAGHFSPIGGYHPGRDMLLVLDVARFKYPPHWVALVDLFGAMRDADPVTCRARGWLMLKKRAGAIAVARLLLCTDGLGTGALIERLLALQSEAFLAQPPSDMAALLMACASAISESGITERVRLRPTESVEQRQLLDEMRSWLASLPLHALAFEAVGPERAASTVLWLLAAPESCFRILPAQLRSELATLVEISHLPAPFASELRLLRSQVDFLLEDAVEPMARVG